MRILTKDERAFTLIEVTVATAIIVVAVAGALTAFNAIARYATNQGGLRRAAALAFANQLVEIAQDTWKYGSPGPSPAGRWQTTLQLAMPNASATTMPVSVSAIYQQLRTPDPSGIDPSTPSALVTVTVAYTPEPGRDDSGVVSAQATLHVQALPPGAQISLPGNVPAPVGAP
ncbi:MAG: type II secretion system protein [Vulcanimicrobiaceae bacterium]